MQQAEFAQRVQEGRNRLNLIAQEMQRLAATILGEQAQVQKRIAAVQKAWPQAAEDVKQQLARLLQPGFLARTPWERLQHFPRYVKAAGLRLEKLRADPARDAQRMAELAPLEQAWRRELRRAPSWAARPARKWSSSAGCWRNCGYRSLRRN